MSEGKLKLLTRYGVPIDRIGGFETEYALTCELEGGVHIDVADQVVANRAVPVEDQFREDGSRIYLDVGNHPEFSTAEEGTDEIRDNDSYMNQAYRLLLGHIAMENIFREYAKTTEGRVSINSEGLEFIPNIKNVHLIANTCDNLGNSWGSHENLLTRSELHFSEFVPALAIHNASRIVWSGAGHVQRNRFNRDNFKYHLSEKAEHFWELASSGTTKRRPLVNLRDEPLADARKHRRVHGISGETVFSPEANALRQASTSILLKACELSVNFDDLMPENVLKAIRIISADPTLKAKVPLANGEECTGIELQKKLIDRASSSVRLAENLTAQETRWLQKWKTILHDLETDPQSCANRVDWVIKLQSIQRALDSRSKKKGKYSDYQVAWGKDVEYHRLLPAEGIGMLLVRKGFFASSPSAEILEKGLVLPNNRASLRGNTIRKLKERKIGYSSDWHAIKSQPLGWETRWMYNPYAPHNEEIESRLEEVA